MYLSSERLAIADRTVQETFEQTSIAWQAIPYWDTGDPAQTRAPTDQVDVPGFLYLNNPQNEAFQLTLAQTIAPTPDSLLAEVMSATVKLAKKVDDIVVKALWDATKYVAKPPPPSTQLQVKPGDVNEILTNLITARALVEDAGYRAPSCLIVNTAALTTLSGLQGGYTVLDTVLAAANVNSLHRATNFSPNETDTSKQKLLLLGRRQRIAHGDAADASPGEEPVDLAVSVMPSLEVIGEDANGDIELAVRINFVTRVKDASGVVAIVDK